MFRIGHGYDVHRFADNRKLVLGGEKIPFAMGLDGHSDADVLAHSVCDALLGAAALGDIGSLFPDNDSRYEGADSMELLTEVCRLIASAGYKICNIDATVIAQEPKLQPFIGKMRLNIAAACGLSDDMVSVKATTEEGLGFTGQKLGIASHAVVLAEKTEKVVQINA